MWCIMGKRKRLVRSSNSGPGSNEDLRLSNASLRSAPRFVRLMGRALTSSNDKLCILWLFEAQQSERRHLKPCLLTYFRSH
jgi:hypothetical protein